IATLSAVPRGDALFDSIVVMENYPFDARLRAPLGGLHVVEAHSVEITNYPLTLTVLVGEELRFRLVYDRASVSRDHVTALVARFQTLLVELARDASRPLGLVPMVSEPETRRLLGWASGTPAAPAGTLVPQRIETWAHRAPDAVAVVDGATT